jgi:RHS repeat-associated protein
LKRANGFKSTFGAIRGFNGESARAARRVAEEQQGGAASADLLLGLNVDERFARAGSTVLTDALGSTVALAAGASIQTQYGYDPYGVAQTTGVAWTNPYQFTGRENDPTAAGLMYYRARYYSPAWGRFISEDPIGIAGGANLYAYAEGNPVDFRDPSGSTAAGAAAGAGWGGSAGGALGEIIDPLGGGVPGSWIGEVLGAILGDWWTGPDIDIPTIWCSKGGKQNIRDTGLIGVTDEEIDQRLRDPNTSAKEKQRLKREQKARGNRNVQKRDN